MTYRAIPPTTGSEIDVLSDWGQDQIGFLSSLAIGPSLSSPRVLTVGGRPLATNGADGGIQGGSWTATDGNISQLSTTTLLTPATTPFAFVAKAKFGAPTVARASVVGLANAAGTHTIDFGTVHAGSATKFVLRLIGGATNYDPTTADADTAVHTFAAVSDTTNVTLYVDGVDSGAALAVSLMSGDEAYIPFLFNTISLDAIIQYALVAW